jgi:hypothetical protein
VTHDGAVPPAGVLVELGAFAASQEFARVHVLESHDPCKSDRALGRL